LKKQLLLPTYLVLPRNPGSKLQGTNPDIRKSYGYLEFLAHEPKPTTKPQNVNDSGAIASYLKRGWWRAHPNPDWITREWSDVAVCMRTWGRLGAIAYVLLLSDLHYENRRLRFRRPHLIDLEMGFLGTMDLLSRTALFQKLDRAVQDSAGKIEVRIDDGPSGPVSRAGSQLGSTLHYGTDQLYLADVETSRHPVFRDPDLSPHVVRGIKDVFEHLTREKLTAWADQINLSQLIVRFAYPENFSGTMIEAAGSIVRKRPAGAKNDRQAAARQELRDFWAGFLEGRRKFNLSNDAVSGWLDGWPRTGDPGRRFYALETPDYLGADFINLDLPRFYRRIGSRELLTSRGDPVRFQPEFLQLDKLFTEQERKTLKYIFDFKTEAEAALQFDQFFVTTGLDDFTRSMQEKLLQDAKSRRALLVKQIRGVQLGKKDPYQAGILPDMDVKTLFEL
jgi:hypothetical protein